MKVLAEATTLSGLILVVALLGTLLHPADAQQGKRSFEYKVVIYTEPATVVQEKPLNDLGRQGWEFVTYMPVGRDSGHHAALFKR